MPVVREEKHRPRMRLRQPQRLADAVHPSDIVKAPLVSTITSLSFEALWFNTSAFPLDTKEVRQALAYATDRDAVVTQLFKPVQPDITVTSPDVPALDLLSTILGDGRSSRLYRRDWNLYPSRAFRLPASKEAARRAARLQRSPDTNLQFLLIFLSPCFHGLQRRRNRGP